MRPGIAEATETATGFTSFTAALQVGDSFYYSAIGVDKPAEREVGRGTLLSGGSISRNPISGKPTNFSCGTKTVALIAAAFVYGLGGAAASMFEPVIAHVVLPPAEIARTFWSWATEVGPW